MYQSIIIRTIEKNIIYVIANSKLQLFYHTINMLNKNNQNFVVVYMYDDIKTIANPSDELHDI